MLTDDDLRAVDRTLIAYLAEGRVTPAYARARLDDEGIGEYSRGYVQQRLARLEEHDHATNLFETGLYELVDDPREGKYPCPRCGELFDRRSDAINHGMHRSYQDEQHENFEMSEVPTVPQGVEDDQPD